MTNTNTVDTTNVEDTNLEDYLSDFEIQVPNTPPLPQAMVAEEFPFRRTNDPIPPLISDHGKPTINPTLAGPMAPTVISNSTSMPMFSSVKLDNIKPLKGHENYETWSSQVTFVLYAMGARALIIDNNSANLSPDKAETLRYQVLLIFIQLVSSNIMAQISHLMDPHAIWVYLKETYYPDSYYSFVHQMDVLFSIKSSLDTSKPIASFIHKFEEEWMRLHQLASSGSSTSKYRKLMKEVLEQDEAKRDLLLSSLISHYPNAVDNLMTKDKLT